MTSYVLGLSLREAGDYIKGHDLEAEPLSVKDPKSMLSRLQFEVVYILPNVSPAYLAVTLLSRASSKLGNGHLEYV